MGYIEKEKAILEEAPDFETQRQILNEEKEAQRKLRKFYTRIGCIFFLVFAIIIVSYVKIDIYIEYNYFSNDACYNVNIGVDDEEFKILNIAQVGTCAPEFNIDYINDRRATFNIDLFGDKTEIFNPVNQKDENGYCKVNCDSNNDGWPDYNIDLNGDGIPDLNIIKDHVNGKKCDLNCDLNNDMLPDTNIDIDGDGNADINITSADDRTKPIYNIDYKGNRIPEFNILNEDGTISNPVNDATVGKTCDLNCDLDGDGWPDYNIKLNKNDYLLNEIIEKGNNSINYDKSKLVDWKCYISPNLESCYTGNISTINKYINIDVNGDGIPDVNISYDHGTTIENEISKPGVYNDRTYRLNEDYDKDGFPEFNIDLNNDGIPDLNITDGTNPVCIKNCDANFDGIADNNIDYDGTGRNSIGIKNINLDTDFDTKCDVNCDLNYDLYPDINVDVTGDNIPDVNIDYDGDGIPDFNIDTNGDGKADTNLSARLDGICNFNCTDRPETTVDNSEYCQLNCDTDNDGWPDKNVDLNYDGICDINCDDDPDSIDSNHDYFRDKDDKTKDMIIDKSDKSVFYVLNPIDIKNDDIEPGWEDTYVLRVTNNTQYVIVYNLKWDEVKNEFTTENNLDYNIVRNSGRYFDNLKAPYQNTILKDNIYIRPNTSVQYVLNMTWKETGVNQNIDSNKIYKSKFTVSTKK